jgi:photosystem II stability/assembly factor-like uncharacterized protein
MESEDEVKSLSSPSRMRRALTMMTISVITIGVAGLAYLHPGLGLSAVLHRVSGTAGASASYQLAAVDFVTPTAGWVVMESAPQTFAVLHTANSGETWTRQLTGPAGSIGEYARFFDPAHGVLVLLGTHGALYQTSDGGSTWSLHTLDALRGDLLSADFVDADRGWLLARDPTEGEALVRTVDGGKTWVVLGNPVLYSDWAYRVAFADPSHGWLYSQSLEPYAYRSDDGGISWDRVPMPAPPGGWPAATGGSTSSGEFFVAVHPTQGEGVIATVVAVAPPNGRIPAGGTVLGFPPLRVSSFDGGRPVVLVYDDVSPDRYSSIDYVNPSAYADVHAAHQTQLSSVDGGETWKPVAAPSPGGAVGYVDALNWWWIGSGAGSTSSDAGITWTRVRSLGVPEPLPGSLQFIDSTHAWFGAMAGPRPLVETTDDGGTHWSMALLPAATAP